MHTARAHPYPQYICNNLWTYIMYANLFCTREYVAEDDHEDFLIIDTSLMHRVVKSLSILLSSDAPLTSNALSRNFSPHRFQWVCLIIRTLLRLISFVVPRPGCILTSVIF